MANLTDFRILFYACLLFCMSATTSDAARFNNFVVTTKYSSDLEGYFDSPDLIKARNYWETRKTIDTFTATSIPVATQINYPAGSQTADVFIPDNLEIGRPLGIYIHVNAGDTANLPSNFDAILQDNYLIGACPDNVGNNRHDPERLSRVLDLVETLKGRYLIDESRIYVGGTSGGALIALLGGMLYPETFTGIIATEHVMAETYWNRVFTEQEMRDMAARGQRWSHILGEESYAYFTLAPRATGWKYLAEFEHTGGSSYLNYEPFFDTYNLIVEGMGHSNPAPESLQKALNFIDAPNQIPKAKSYQDWMRYAFRLDDPSTVFLSYATSDGRPQAPDPTLNRAPDDDYDGDGKSNAEEYLMGSDPTKLDYGNGRTHLTMEGTEAILRHRAGAMDSHVVMHTSSDLSEWDTTGAGAHASSPTMLGEQSMGTTRFSPANGDPNRFFYQPSLNYTPLINLTQLPGAVATQSNTAWAGPPEYAIDGNRDGVMANGSTTHTDSVSANWWQVELGGNYAISRIQFFNRAALQNRLSNFKVSILNAAGTEIASRIYYPTQGHTRNFEKWDLPAGVKGKTVRIEMLGTNRGGNTILSLAEVEVLGTGQ